jgi:hypothetical protein
MKHRTVIPNKRKLILEIIWASNDRSPNKNVAHASGPKPTATQTAIKIAANIFPTKAPPADCRNG